MNVLRQFQPAHFSPSRHSKPPTPATVLHAQVGSTGTPDLSTKLSCRYRTGTRPRRGRHQPARQVLPPYESYELKRVAPERRVTGALDHTELNFSLADARGFAALDAFAVRSLREAHLED